MLLRIFICLMLCCSLGKVNAQLTENFSDGNLDVDPIWSGDTDEFLIDAAFDLQSNGDTISSTNREIYISTPSTAINETQWEFFVNPKVSTSSNNRMDVFLTSDIAQLTGDNRGYFVRIGGTPDEVALFRKDGTGNETYVITGTSGIINSSSSNPTKVKVTRDAAGNWTLFADYEGSGLLYNLIGAANDVTYLSSAHFGLLVRYSNTNRQKYYFDDVYVGDIIVDLTPPEVLQLNVTGAQNLELVFSENIEETSAQRDSNYLASNGLGFPDSSIRNPLLFQRVNLEFASPFVEGQIYTLEISGVKDLAGNTIATTTRSFVYYRAKPYDIVINEIMADPTPEVLQPDAEWIELHNRTQYPINLENWILKVNTTERTIPAVTILPDSFLVLTSLSGFEAYFGAVAVKDVASFPGLTNTGASISLIDPNNDVISSVTYSDQWYNDNVKNLGGWSLEQISPLKPCEGTTNWTASNDAGGATPGRQNSVFQNASDATSPEISRIVLVSNDTIRVFFNESVPAESASNLNAYSIDNGIGSPVGIVLYPPDFKSVKLALPNAISSGIIYSLTIADTLRDCVGNPFNASKSGRFAVPEQVAPNDIVINEILSDPRDNGSDFVEIYNRSTKIIDLSTIILSGQDTVANVLEDAEQIAPEGYLMFPGEYLVLTEDENAVKTEYLTSVPNAFFQMLDFPAFNNEDGIVVLSTLSSSEIIDRRVYFTDLHFALLNTLDGVSLERINFDRPSTDNTNWNSASSQVGYATPGYRNSQFALISEAQTGDLSVSPEVFSPDNDGFDDVLSISYRFDQPGYTGTFAIYDSKGRLVKYVGRAQLLGTEGTLSWNGINEDNEKAGVGIYVVYMEAFDLKGNVVKIKKPCVVASKL
jgi:hypothetical protein